ncbi:hypothetical protein EVAR_5730_1 [Eumeta japonica]|uniref:Uncharacterized protein n=1 Tax=Eumeta variegata TaxID=151549 RepID=A0A4C1T775_EUMVA|nr:hypothetical protein EVAR_5730_1 [Eumeta japonica]
MSEPCPPAGSGKELFTALYTPRRCIARGGAADGRPIARKSIPKSGYTPVQMGIIGHARAAQTEYVCRWLAQNSSNFGVLPPD